jgi:predicted ATPase
MNLLLSERGQIVSVMGEAGLGKSRLVAEMHQQMRAQSAHGSSSATRWFEGRCLSYTESVSFLPFQEIVRQMANIRQDDSEAEAWGKLRGSLDKWLGSEEGSANLPYLGTFLNLPLKDTMQDKVRHLDAEALQRRMFVALGALIEAQARAAPLVLVLEDIHWIDQASIQLIEYLMPTVNRAPLMLLLLYRPERSKGCWEIHEKVAREFPHCATDIALHPLAATESQALLNNLVQVARWPAEMRELILNRTEGNPLYLEEVLRALMDSRTLIQDDSGQWQISGRLDASQIPDTLQGVMMARLDQLEELHRGTAQVASVVGRIFAFDVLAHVVPENGNKLNTSLVGLQQHEIVRETQRVPELGYSFRHALMQEVCYHSLSARARRQYHCKIAEYLCEAASRRELESQFPLIAHHAFTGQDWRRALQYQLLAGQQAQRLYANHEAIDHFEKAMQSAENLPPAETIEQRQTIHVALGELLVTTGQYDRALQHLQEALALAIEHGDRDAQARACRWLARLHELRGEYPTAFEWIEKGLAALMGRQTTEAAELSLTAGLIHTRQGLYDQALDQSQNSLTIAQQLGEVAVLARSYNLLGHVTRLLGQSALAIEHFQRAFDLYQGAGDISGQALAHNQIANACADMGQWQKAERHYCQAREIFDQVGDVYHRAMADSNLGEIALTHGRLDEALAFYQEALRSIEQIGGSAWMLGVFHNNLGHTFIRRGQAEAALEHLRASLKCFEQIQARDFLPELHRHFAEADLLSGQLAEAEAHGQQALSLAHELSMQSEAGSSLRVLGEIAATQGRLDRAAQHLSESILILGQVGDEYGRARSQLSLAQVYATLRKPQEAAAALDLCVPVFERLEAALDLAAAQSLREKIR